jgi:hypothetical protein
VEIEVRVLPRSPRGRIVALGRGVSGAENRPESATDWRLSKSVAAIGDQGVDRSACSPLCSPRCVSLSTMLSAMLPRWRASD